MQKEDEILLAGIEDKMDKCESGYMMTNSSFLDMRQRSLVENLCRKHSAVRTAFYGGYDDAERCIALFLPDYVGADVGTFFSENPEENPLVVLKMKQTGGRELSHRDYLGSLTGLGVKREKIGDILVAPKGADIIVLREIAEFLLFNYGKAGRASLTAEIAPLSELILPEVRFQEFRDTVASLRLDNVTSSAFRISRTVAAQAIAGGIVFVNNLQVLKIDKQVNEGDKIVLRGKGKVILSEIGGTSKKDRTYITIKKYI